MLLQAAPDQVGALIPWEFAEEGAIMSVRAVDIAHHPRQGRSPQEHIAPDRTNQAILADEGFQVPLRTPVLAQTLPSFGQDQPEIATWFNGEGRHHGLDSLDLSGSDRCIQADSSKRQDRQFHLGYLSQKMIGMGLAEVVVAALGFAEVGIGAMQVRNSGEKPERLGFPRPTEQGSEEGLGFVESALARRCRGEETGGQPQVSLVIS